MRLRRAHGVVCYWYDGEFTVHPYLRGGPVAVHPVVAEVLTAFEEWVEPGKAAELLDHLTPETVADAVTVLREAGLLLVEDSPEAERDAHVAREWGSWAPEAPFFHYATQDLVAASRADGGQVTDESMREPVTSLFTGYPEADRLLLPRRAADLAVPYDQVLYSRRTHRDFTDEPVPLETLATLLATTFGPVDYIDCGAGALYRRTSPAGGSRQELDAYLAIRAVVGVSPGVYHYNALEHSLELLGEGLTADEAVYMGADQDWVGQAAFMVVLTAVIDRMYGKYRTPRCYRVSLLNAGHLGQTFALTATALGLGPAQTGAFRDTAVADRLGLDNIGHTPMYLLAAGWPHPAPVNGPPPADMRAFHQTTMVGRSSARG